MFTFIALNPCFNSIKESETQRIYPHDNWQKVAAFVVGAVEMTFLALGIMALTGTLNYSFTAKIAFLTTGGIILLSDLIMVVLKPGHYKFEKEIGFQTVKDKPNRYEINIPAESATFPVLTYAEAVAKQKNHRPQKTRMGNVIFAFKDQNATPNLQSVSIYVYQLREKQWAETTFKDRNIYQLLKKTIALDRTL